MRNNKESQLFERGEHYRTQRLDSTDISVRPVRLRLDALAKIASGRLLLATALYGQDCHNLTCIVKLVPNPVSATYDNLPAV